MTTWRAYASIGAALLVVGTATFSANSASAAAPTSVQAQSQQRANPHPTMLTGNITAVGANTITLSTRKGAVTANISPDTWIVVKKAGMPGQGTLADLKANERATVAGMTTSNPQVVDARVVTQGVREAVAAGRQGRGNRGPLGPGVQGTVKAINGPTLTVTIDRGFDVQVETTADTIVLNNGFKNAASIQTGDRIQVLGGPQRINRNARPTRDNVKLNAWGIRVVKDGVDLAAGRVTSVSGNNVTLDRMRSSAGLTVNLSGSTQYRSLTIDVANRKATLTNASQADVKPESNIIVEGTRSADGKSISAISVIILPERPLQRP